MMHPPDQTLFAHTDRFLLEIGWLKQKNRTQVLCTNIEPQISWFSEIPIQIVQMHLFSLLVCGTVEYPFSGAQ